MSLSGLRLLRALNWVCIVTLVACLGGCGSPARPKPTELSSFAPLLDVKRAWRAEIGEVSFPLDVKVIAADVFVATSGGLVQRMDAQVGVARWSLDLEERISAGVGADGDRAAVVTAAGELVVIENGKNYGNSGWVLLH